MKSLITLTRAEFRELGDRIDDAPAAPISSPQVRAALERLDTIRNRENRSYAISEPVVLAALFAIEILPFDVGDLVAKVGGDYAFVGHVVAVFRKHASNEMRVVVENAERLIHIFHPRQLQKVETS
ncbi:MAG: hypothetical protein E6Q97_02875 [Desulfurellales bacterium]|nr:MAG: hypothetical protein E6Q97_02875 [Desulfurellales bacterium]